MDVLRESGSLNGLKPDESELGDGKHQNLTFNNNIQEPQEISDDELNQLME
jgi:hypothetical protein